MIDRFFYKEDNQVFRLTINMEYDCPLNPREDYDNIGHMICFSKYILGDKHDHSDPYDFLESLMDEANLDHDDDLEIGKAILTLQEKADYYFLPLSIYDHSGITMYVGSPYDHFDGQWDCSRVGWIYTTKADIMKEFQQENDESWKKRAYTVLTGEVKTYDLYLRGECYYYNLEKYDPETDDYEDIECVGGYLTDAIGENLAIEMIGEQDYISEEEALALTIDLHAEYIEQEKQNERMFYLKYLDQIEKIRAAIKETLTDIDEADRSRIVSLAIG